MLFNPINRKKVSLYISISMKKITILLFIFFAAVSFSAASSPDFDPELKITTNDDLTVDDFYDIKGDLRITFPATDDIDLIFKTELDKREVDIEELSARLSIDSRNRLKIGKFGNHLTLDEYLGDFDSFLQEQIL